MDTTLAADTLLEEVQSLPVTHAPTMGRLARIRYRHEALIDLIIAHPEWDQNQYASYFGFSPGWISNVMASDAFQAAMAARKEEIINPELKATVEERFRGLVIKSLEVLQAKLNAPNVSDNVALRAAELGAKALGMGSAAPPPQKEPAGDRLERLAARLITLQSNVRTLNGSQSVQILEVEEER